MTGLLRRTKGVVAGLLLASLALSFAPVQGPVAESHGDHCIPAGAAKVAPTHDGGCDHAATDLCTAAASCLATSPAMPGHDLTVESLATAGHEVPVLDLTHAGLPALGPPTPPPNS